MGCLKNLVISATTDVGHKPDQLKKWVEANSGTWVPRVGKSVKITHLICGQGAWKARGDVVQKAQTSGAAIVTFDWLEDSLQARRKLAEKPYLWAKVVHEKKKGKERKKIAKMADTNKFRKGSQKAIEDIGSGESASPCPTSTSSRGSSSSSSLKPGGFFASSLEALKEARLKRELKEKEKEKAASNAGGRTTGDDNKGGGMQVDEDEDADKKFKFKDSGEKAHACSPASPVLAPSPAPVGLPTPASSTRTSPNAGKASPTPPTTTTAPQPSVPQVPEAKPTKLTDNHHLHLDATGFEYSLILVRTNLLHNNHATYALRLYESNTKPHTYCTFVRYTPPKESAAPVVMKNGIPILMPDTSSLPTKIEAATKSKSATNIENRTAPKKQLFEPSTPPIPPPNTPYRTLLTPLNSPFAPAFLTFRHAFRDTTLLAWEERSYPDVKNRQKARAKELGVEPYTYRPPMVGLPAGDKPAFPLPIDSKEEGYVRGGLGLPGIEAELSSAGAIGNVIHREAEEAKKIKEEEEERERECVKAMHQNQRMKAKGAAETGSKRPNWNKPLFNSVSGPGIVGNAGGYGAMGFVKRGERYKKFFYKD